MNIKLNAGRVLAVASARGIAGISGIATRLGVHRSTVSRWLSSAAPALPGSAAQALALSAILDIDPLTLFDAPVQDFGKLCVRLHRAARSGDWEQFHPVFEFAGAYCSPHDEWPPQNVSRFFRREWHIRDFPVSPSDAGVGYATLDIVSRNLERVVTPESGTMAPPPRVWHLAFRDTASIVPQPWRPYGALIFTEGRLRIASLRGFVMDDVAAGSNDAGGDGVIRAQVQVWIGANAGVLRVASLHRFKARWQPAESEAGEAKRDVAGPSTFRFCEQGFRCHEPGTTTPCPFADRCGGYQVDNPATA